MKIAIDSVNPVVASRLREANPSAVREQEITDARTDRTLEAIAHADRAGVNPSVAGKFYHATIGIIDGVRGWGSIGREIAAERSRPLVGMPPPATSPKRASSITPAIHCSRPNQRVSAHRSGHDDIWNRPRRVGRIGVIGTTGRAVAVESTSYARGIIVALGEERLDSGGEKDGK